MIQILLVDNHSEYLDVMAEFLHRRGYQPYCAKTLQEATDHMLNRRLDLAIVDVRMTDNDDDKDSSGLRFIEKWYQIGHTPFIVISTYEPMFEYVRNILKTQPGKRPPALNFLLKQEGLHALKEAIDEVVCPEKSELFDMLVRYFSLGELNELCSLHLNVDFETIAGTDKRSKALNLIEYCERNLSLVHLYRAIRTVRQNV